MAPLPLVTVAMPLRNEEKTVAAALEAILEQTYPLGSLELLIVEGRSEDATRSVVERTLEDRSVTARLLERFELMTNTKRTAAAGLNLALGNSRGEVFIRVDGHSIVPRDYVERCVETLDSTGADCVGGALQNEGHTCRARGIAHAQSSFLGTGGARFRQLDAKPGWVDTVPFGAYQMRVFGRIGMFDEDLIRNQDDELNLRLRQMGGRVWLDPSIRTRYFVRSSLSALARQYFGYGVYRVLTLRKRGSVAGRHLAPPALVIGLALVGGQGVIARRLKPSLVVSGAYGCCVVMGAAVASRKDLRAAPWTAVAYPIMHVSYGAGFARGLLRWHRGLLGRARAMMKTGVIQDRGNERISGANGTSLPSGESEHR